MQRRGTDLSPRAASEKRAIEAAHIVAIAGPVSFHLTDRLGREFSVFRQAVRTYRPKFNPNLDEPFAHPLGLPHRIQEWPEGGLGAYSRLLVSQALVRPGERGCGATRSLVSHREKDGRAAEAAMKSFCIYDQVKDRLLLGVAAVKADTIEVINARARTRSDARPLVRWPQSRAGKGTPGRTPDIEGAT